MLNIKTGSRGIVSWPTPAPGASGDFVPPPPSPNWAGTDSTPSPTRFDFWASGSRFLPWLAVATVFLLSGCQKEDLRAYRIPKDTAKPSASSAQSAQTAAAEITFNPPSGWIQMTPGPMQQALFTVKGSDSQVAQVSVVMLAGPAGGELDNVNRWRGQVKLAPIQAEDLQSLTEEVEIAGVTGHLFDLGGAPAEGQGSSRILAAILPRDGNSWFFKMTGPDALVQAQKNSFKEFLKGVRFQSEDQAPPVQTAGSPSSADTTVATPAGWKIVAPGSMQMAKYNISGEGNDSAEVTVSELAGEGGGLLANVNRWRGQLGLGAIEASALAGLTSRLTVGSGEATLVDLVNEDQKIRLLVGMVPANNKTVFYKLLGPQALVGREKDAFLRFLQSSSLK